MSRLTDGNVAITINDKDFTLKPTLRAMEVISGQFDGLANARDKLVKQDFNAIVFMIRHGLNLTDRDAKMLREDVYENGLTVELIMPLIRYIGILQNGGKPLPDDPVDDVIPAASGNE